MGRFTLDERVRVTIGLALTANARDPLQRRQQDIEARRLGLSGAEIDAARRGWSFDVRTSIALALVTASSEDQLGVQRRRALKAGISEETCAAILALASNLERAASGKI